MTKLALLLIPLFLVSCVTTGSYSLVATADTIEVTNISAAGPNEAVAVGYDRKSKKAYLAYANGERTNIRVIGGGIGGGVFTLVLEGGTKVSVDLKTGKVTTTGPQFEPLPTK